MGIFRFFPYSDRKIDSTVKYNIIYRLKIMNIITKKDR